MVAIEYGIDAYGRKVYAYEAHKKRTYTCPYCLEEIHVCKGNINRDYFAHNPITNRTPQQMICPGYKGEGTFRKIGGKVDQVYITNGGIPLYLCEYEKETYQLNAYFPPISKINMELLNAWDAIVEVTESGKREIYSINNLKYYRLKTSSEWIKVSCKNTKYSIPEVKQKWEWGIRGLNYAKDIFHSNENGGYRVALHSSIVVGKEYLIVIRNDVVSQTKGVSCSKKGFIKLNDSYRNSEYSVYSMIVHEVTETTIAYIHNKGYQLIERSDDIIPIWPPAVFEGKELIYREPDKRAFLFHEKHSSQCMFTINEYGLCEIEEDDNIVEVSTNNRTVLLSDYQFNILSDEIKYVLTQTRENFKNPKFFTPSIKWINDYGIECLLTEDTDLSINGKVYLEADVDFTACVLDGDYIKKSTRRVLENVMRNKKIIISIEPFGKIFIENSKIKEKAIEKNVIINISSIVNELYRCDSARVPIDNNFKELYSIAKNYSYELFNILNYWAVKNKMPYMAKKYLYQIKEVLKNE